MVQVTEFHAVKANMLSMLKYANLEFKEYKKSGDIIYLQQAGEKLFNAVENYIQFVQQTRYSSYYELTVHTKEKSLRRLLYDTKRLHQFFYNGELEMREEDAMYEFIRLSTLLELRIKRLHS